MMTCREFENILDDLAEGRAGIDVQQEAALHLKGCSDCRDLEALDTTARGSLAGLPRETGIDLTAGILARTSGSSCSAARDILPAHVDATLDAGDDELVRLHVASCSACRSLADTLVWLGAALPQLAELEPDALFLTDVMTATVYRQPWISTLAARLQETFTRYVLRPRFATEFAFIGAVLAWLLFGASFAPFQQVPQAAMQLTRGGDSVALASAIPLPRFIVRPDEAGRRAWESTGGKILDDAQPAGGEWTGTLREAAVLTRSAGSNGLRAATRALGGEFDISRDYLGAMRSDLSNIWKLMTTEPTDDKDEGGSDGTEPEPTT